MNSFYPIILFFIQIVALYFISRITINETFYVLRKFVHSDSVVFSIISILFLPGTIIHEMSHFIMAICMFLRVVDIKIIPEWEKNYIKLGRVLYEKKDVFRSIIVGIAPIFGGMFFFWILSIFKIFPSSNIFLNIVLGYIVFIVSTTMFSSKQDLIDIGYLIPLFIVIAGILYIFNINPLVLLSNNPQFFDQVNSFLYKINFYAIFSLAIHVFIIIAFKLFRKYF